MDPDRQTRALGPHFVSSQISKTGKEIKDFVEAEAGNDPLLKGVPEDKNPFKEKGGCVIS
ncbi:guanine nucleotide-binding protein G(I)/G(S)/G(O) subunit gamma-T2 [Puma concolor]|uniref:Guanine nucleotide-binding protein subunit gamma n=1 Tax=Puma concolor TaxID=9696 RepID=A0A6P6HC25_PUMCO|nr:guanine nucleotide-binding protein G(I)/G(S)/G(O) subunit gamma-T2 [Puma concolor]